MGLGLGLHLDVDSLELDLAQLRHRRQSRSYYMHLLVRGRLAGVEAEVLERGGAGPFKVKHLRWNQTTHIVYLEQFEIGSRKVRQNDPQVPFSLP